MLWIIAMQVLNIDTGTAEPIKHLSLLIDELVEESKMSDRELIGLILTIKGCRDCFHECDFNFNM